MSNRYFIFSDVHIGKKLPDDGKLHMQSLHYLNEKAKEFKTPDINYIGVVCGDLFDSRLKLNTSDILKAKIFIDEMCAVFDKVYLVTGNHDMYNADPGSPNILDIFVNQKVTVVKSFLHNEDGVFIPFDDPILSDSDRLLEEADENTYCFCHQAVKGIAPPLASGIISDVLFDKFKLTIAGHIHIRTHSRKVISIGAPSSFSFADTDVDKFGALYIDENGNTQFIDSPYYLKYKILVIDTLKDLDKIYTLEPRCTYCIKLIVNPEISSKVDYAIDNTIVTEFSSFKKELSNSNIIQTLDIDEDLQVGDTNSIISVLRKEFEGDNQTLEVFNNIVNDVIRESEEND